MNILGMVEYNDIDDAPCLRSTGEVIFSLRNVSASCIVPMKPSLEESESELAGVLVTNAVMKIASLLDIFSNLSSSGKNHIFRKGTVICPIQVGDQAVFVMKAPTSAGQDLSTCMLCDPPMVIGKPAFNESERQRALRNHAAAHLLSQHSEDERCAFCCQTNYQLNLDILN